MLQYGYRLMSQRIQTAVSYIILYIIGKLFSKPSEYLLKSVFDMMIVMVYNNVFIGMENKFNCIVFKINNIIIYNKFIQREIVDITL